jgi:hypothetical protein
LEHEGVKIAAADILGDIERIQEEVAVDSALKIIDAVLAEPEPEPVIRKPEATYRRDGSGHRRPPRRG